MKRSITIIALLAAAICTLGGCKKDTVSVQMQSFCQKQDQPIRRVAVVDFAGEAGQAIADILSMHLARCGYEIVERQNIDDLLGKAINPIAEGETSATITERLNTMGKLLNAVVIITGDLVNIRPPFYMPDSKRENLIYEGAICQISARAFSVRTREIFWTGVVNVVASAKTGENLGLLGYIDQACYELVESFRSDNYTKNGTQTYKGLAIEQRQH